MPSEIICLDILQRCDRRSCASRKVYHDGTPAGARVHRYSDGRAAGRDARTVVRLLRSTRCNGLEGAFFEVDRDDIAPPGNAPRRDGGPPIRQWIWIRESGAVGDAPNRFV